MGDALFQRFQKKIAKEINEKKQFPRKRMIESTDGLPKKKPKLSRKKKKVGGVEERKEPEEPVNVTLSPCQQAILDTVFSSEAPNLMISGKGGSGKSLLVRFIHEECKKRKHKLMITATTGIAARILGNKAKTAHSALFLFFMDDHMKRMNPKNRTEYELCLLEATNSAAAFVKDSKQRLEKLRSVDMIIIDEVSLLDFRTFDMMNFLLQNIRENDLPFGGVQMILVGDFFQLPPVSSLMHHEIEYIQEFRTAQFKGMPESLSRWKILSETFPLQSSDIVAPSGGHRSRCSPAYCFWSKWWDELIPYVFVLEQTFRQQEGGDFSEVLEEIRQKKVGQAISRKTLQLFGALTRIKTSIEEDQLLAGDNDIISIVPFVRSVQEINNKQMTNLLNSHRSSGKHPNSFQYIHSSVMATKENPYSIDFFRKGKIENDMRKQILGDMGMGSMDEIPQRSQWLKGQKVSFTLNLGNEVVNGLPGIIEEIDYSDASIEEKYPNSSLVIFDEFHLLPSATDLDLYKTQTRHPLLKNISVKEFMELKDCCDVSLFRGKGFPIVRVFSLHQRDSSDPQTPMFVLVTPIFRKYIRKDRLGEPVLTKFLEFLPLRTCWASTVHSIQGRTLYGQAILHTKGCFAPGQMYVMFSRVKQTNQIIVGPEGLSLEAIFADPYISWFYEEYKTLPRIGGSTGDSSSSLGVGSSS